MIRIEGVLNKFLRDARYFQISVLSLLLFYGSVFNELGFSIAHLILSLLGTLATQFICTKIWRVPNFEPKSALISGLSLTLLLRTNNLWLTLLGAVLTVSSKFILRIKDKHIFNPTNFGIGILLLFSNGVWVSPGQWGSEVIFAAFLACLGLIVVKRARRSDVTYAFLFSYASLMILRATYLGDPLTIPLHQMSNGALIIFAFFMISDPKTTPDTRLGRILFAVGVALVAYYFRFYQFNTNGLILSLLIMSILVPLIDTIWRGVRFEWVQKVSLKPDRATSHETFQGEVILRS